MKKIVCLLLSLILCAACAGAETFAAGSAYEARMKALDVFDICALSAECPGENSVQGYLIRWDKSIRAYIEGSPSREDRSTVERFFMELALRVPDMPNITLTTRKSDANMYIYFGPLDQLSNHVPGYVPGNWGMFHYNYWNWCMQEAYVGIATDVTNQRERNHLIQEEIVGALGLANDHMIYSDSILYQAWTTVQELSEVDWLMLNMVYSPLVTPGMDMRQLHRIFINAWTK